MSLFDSELYQWRETYFVFFPSANHPSLETVRKAIAGLDDRFVLEGGTEDADGHFESLSVLAPEAYAAMDICFGDSEESAEQLTELSPELCESTEEEETKEQLAKLPTCNAKIDVMHFEQLTMPSSFDEEDEEPFGMLDPSAVLSVLRQLADLTGGIAVDPAASCVI